MARLSRLLRFESSSGVNLDNACKLRRLLNVGLMHMHQVPARSAGRGKIGGETWRGGSPADRSINVRVPIVADVVELETCRKLSPQSSSHAH